jgi:hypothetical protein
LRDSLQGYSAEELYVDISAANENVGGQLRSIMEEGGLEYVRFSFRRPDLGQWAIEYNAAQTAIQQAAKERELVAVEEAKANQAVKQAEGSKQKVMLEAEGQAAAAKAKAMADADAAAYSTREQAEADLYRRQQAADAALYEQGKQAEGIKVLASAEADAIRLKAEAEAEGYAMKAAAVTPDFIELIRWQNWNGQLPTWTMNDTSSGFVFDVPAPQATSVPPAKPETP